MREGGFVCKEDIVRCGDAVTSVGLLIILPHRPFQDTITTNMNQIDTEILNIDKVISANIDRFDTSERGLLSQNILSQLRNFVDHISLKSYSNGKNIDNTY